MEQNKDKVAWQDFLEESGYNDPSQVETVQACRVMNKAAMSLFVNKLLAQVTCPDRVRILRQIDAAFRAELGATDTNAYCVAMAADNEKPPKRKYVNTTDEAELFPELYKFCQREIDTARVSDQRKEDAKRYLSLYMEKWEKGQETAPQPQQIAPQPQQMAKPTRGKGRPKETFKDKMINDGDGSKLQKMHTLLDGKKGKDAALIILAGIMKGLLTKPTYTQVINEFGDIGSKTGYNRYLNKDMFTKEEFEGAINSLD